MAVAVAEIQREIEQAIRDEVPADDLIALDMEREAAAAAREDWRVLFCRIIDEGGIIPPGEDYDAIPVCVRAKAGLPIDQMADLFGFDYIQDFVDYVAAVHRRFKAIEGKVFPSLPWHADRPGLQRLLEQYRDAQRAYRQALTECGSASHPAVLAAGVAKEERRAVYRAACQAAGIEPSRA